MDIKDAIRQVTTGGDLAAAEMAAAMRRVMSGETTDAQNAALLVGLQMKGVKVAEILGAASVMRELATPVKVKPGPHLVDTCGTGGSGAGKFNVSTAAAMVAACAGARVAKHGNRGATSKSGSADLLEAAGYNLALDARQIGELIDRVGVGFLFAPAHHGAMKHVIAARREIGVRTIFNLLGPLTNPAGAPNQLMGVFDTTWIRPLLEVLNELGGEHVLIVAAEDGLDEISIAAATRVGELKDGKISEYRLTPEAFGFERATDIDDLRVDSPAASLELVNQALSWKNDKAAALVALNAGAAIYAAGRGEDLAAGIASAVSIQQSGAALDKFRELVAASQSSGK
ncbi:MAG: anthranilate phosphoribosyltransferase [Gammaproteobacteria bacterium]|nr:anthranilate phosphoribosyltransferase [Gammaproteobacteria bacterium]